MNSGVSALRSFLPLNSCSRSAGSEPSRLLIRHQSPGNSTAAKASSMSALRLVRLLIFTAPTPRRWLALDPTDRNQTQAEAGCVCDEDEGAVRGQQNSGATENEGG